MTAPVKPLSRRATRPQRSPRNRPMPSMPSTPLTPAEDGLPGGPVTQFLRRNYSHFNAGTLVRAADAYAQVIDSGGKMMVTLAGAMSTGELGKTLAEMIRQDKVHAISCTGANLEEDVFNLVGHNEYTPVPDYNDLTPDDEQAMREKGLNRVTDTAIPDTDVVEPVSEAIMALWQAADQAGQAEFPHAYLYTLLLDGTLAHRYQADPNDSWMLAAAQKQLPIVCPGWEDSTLGNEFAAGLMRGELQHATTVMSGIDYMTHLATWYEDATKDGTPVGFFQIGGGIAGDFPICVVPLLTLNMKQEDTPLWAYFCQISDAVTSYGGYSGAAPREKVTWAKLGPDTPMFAIESDASICAPLIFAMVLGL